MLHEEYVRLRQEVAERANQKSVHVMWPHPSDFVVAPESQPVQELYGLHYVATMSKLAEVVSKFDEMQADGHDVEDSSGCLFHGLSEVLDLANNLLKFSRDWNRCLSAGPGCTFPCPCGAS